MQDSIRCESCERLLEPDPDSGAIPLQCPYCGAGALPLPQPTPLPAQQPNMAASVARAVIGMHDESRKSYHQGRLIGSVSAFIWGLLAFMPFLGLVFALIAIVLGLMALSKARKEPGRYSGQGFALAGVILGALSIAGHAGFIAWLSIGSMLNNEPAF